MDYPKNLAALSAATKNAETSTKLFINTLKGKTAEERLSAISTKDLQGKQLEYALTLDGVSAKNRAAVIANIERIRALEQLKMALLSNADAELIRKLAVQTGTKADIDAVNAELTRLKTTTQNILPEKSGTQSGMKWGMAAITALTVSLSAFDQSKVKGFGDSIGSTIGSSVMSGVMGAMTLGPWGALLALVPLLGSAFGDLAGAADRAIEKAHEITEIYRTSTTSAKDNVSTLESLRDEYTKLSLGINEYGETIISAPVVWKYATRTALNRVIPKAA